MNLPRALAPSLTALALVACGLVSCKVVHDPRPRRDPAVGDAIVVCGERVATAAPVVLWSDPGGYDATSAEPRFEPADGGAATPAGRRYEPGRVEKAEAGARVRFAPESADLTALRDVVDLVVLHYDACGTSKECFRVLHDERGLSCHFLLDLDGTVYQTLDVRDQAWHASEANWRSVGIEIANVGAYPPGEPSPLDEWYKRDYAGTRIVIPARVQPTGLRTRSFEARPRRMERVRGEVHGETYEQYDLTTAQYESLIELVATLCATLDVPPDSPRDARGRVRTDALSDAERASFSGVVGHHHLTEAKRDPGPAFTWEPFLEQVRARVVATR